MTESEDTTLEEEVSMFLRRNFPQIQMHGGESSVLKADEESGEVHIALGGACSGCGISPMTVQAIKSRMPKKIEKVQKVIVDTGMGEFNESQSPSFEMDDTEGTSPDVNAPF